MKKQLAIAVVILLALFSFSCAGSNEKPPIQLSEYTADRPLIISHRGSPIDYPEHSFAGYDDAIRKGSDFIELDIILSADNKLVVSHDDNLKRLLNKDIRISDSDYAGLSALTFENGETLHTAEQVFETYKKNIYYVIETKYSQSGDYTMEKELLGLIRAYGLEQHVILQSFHLESLTYLHDNADSLYEMLLLNTGEKAAKLAIQQAPSYIQIITLPEVLVNSAFVDLIRQQNKYAMAYTLNDDAQIELSKQNHLQGFFTNDTQRAMTAYGMG